MITREFVHRTLQWADRELVTMSPLNLEGIELRETIRAHMKQGRPRELVEDKVIALDKVLNALRTERRELNSRRMAKQILLSAPEYQAHLQLLQSFPGISESQRQILIDDFTNGEHYG